ncbi:hypothetical protein [Helicobacter aurati]|uniref:hypothetical protein n=1 Tax=Helicobacter aurati TaxID=137778 RepID=UPI0013152970|nr:hypothetical protein [Helicobacter aurati]
MHCHFEGSKATEESLKNLGICHSKPALQGEESRLTKRCLSRREFTRSRIATLNMTTGG